MKNLLLGILIGFIPASALAVPVVLFVKNDNYKHGRNAGYLNGHAETFVFLRKHFQVTHPSKSISEMQDVLSTKAGNGYVLDDPHAASRHVQKVFERVERLEAHPKLGKRPPELPRLPYRQVLIPPSRVFYRIEEETVYILYVMR